MRLRSVSRGRSPWLRQLVKRERATFGAFATSSTKDGLPDESPHLFRLTVLVSSASHTRHSDRGAIEPRSRGPAVTAGETLASSTRFTRLAVWSRDWRITARQRSLGRPTTWG